MFSEHSLEINTSAQGLCDSIDGNGHALACSEDIRPLLFESMAAFTAKSHISSAICARLYALNDGVLSGLSL